MKTTHTVLVIPVMVADPIHAAEVKDWQDLNALAKCSTGATFRIDSTGFGPYDHDLWIDDEALLHDGAELNPRATSIAKRMIYGDAVVTAVNSHDGETVDIDEAFASRLTQLHEYRPSTSNFLANGQRLGGPPGAA